MEKITLSKQASERGKRVEQFLNLITQANNNGQTVSKKKLIALFCLEHGISLRKVKEYIEILKNLDKVLEVGDELLLKDLPLTSND